MKSFVAAYPPPTLFGYIDATSLAEGRAKEVSILASALKTVLKSPAAAVTNDALAPMLRAGMAHASGAVRALCVEVLRDRTVEDDALRSLLLLRGSDDDSLLGDVVRAVRDEETAVAEGSVRVLLRLSAAPEAAAARARVAAQLIARATARGAATPSASAVAPSVASARCVDLAVRMTCASAEAFAALEPLGALGALADAVSRGGDVLAQLGALGLVERVVAPNAYASLHAVARSADGGALLAQLLRICEDVAGAGGENPVAGELAAGSFRAAAAVAATALRARGSGAAPDAALDTATSRLCGAAYAQLSDPAQVDAAATLAAAEALGKVGGASRAALSVLLAASGGALLRAWLDPLSDGERQLQSLPLRMHTCAVALEGQPADAVLDGGAPAEAFFAAISGAGGGTAAGVAATLALAMVWINGERGGIGAAYRDAACHVLRAAARFGWGVRAMLSTPGFEEWLLTPTACAPLRSDAEWKYGVAQAVATLCGAERTFAATVVGAERLERIQRRVFAGPFKELTDADPHAITMSR